MFESWIRFSRPAARRSASRPFREPGNVPLICCRLYTPAPEFYAAETLGTAMRRSAGRGNCTIGKDTQGNIYRRRSWRAPHAEDVYKRQPRYRCRLCGYPPPYLNFRGGYFSLCLQYWSQAFLELPASSMWRLFIIIDILFVIVIYTINTFFAGNFGWSKKRPRHAHVKTGQYIARVNYALKLRQDGQQQDR